MLRFLNSFVIVESGFICVLKKFIREKSGWGLCSDGDNLMICLNGILVRFVLVLKEVCVICVILLKDNLVIGMVIGICLVNYFCVIRLVGVWIFLGVILK